MRSKSIMLIVILLVALVSLSSAVSARSVVGPVCPTPTPTAVEFTHFEADYITPRIVKLQVQSVVEVDLLMVQFTTANGTPIGQEMPACYPGMMVSCAYMQWVSGPFMSSHPCFALRYMDNNGAWHTFNPGAEGCVE